MQNKYSKEQISFSEFIILMACVTCFVAMAIDLMLPALSDIGADLQAIRSNDIQLIITVIFLGVGLGQIIYGPLSDSTGRKKAVCIGFIIFVVGTLVCLFCTSMEWMLTGRFLQGLGAAGPRIVTMAIVRDRFNGPQMAKVMSSIMTVFIMVPVLAPMIGQGIMAVAGWRAIFAFLLLMAVVVLVWFALRLQETLDPEQRQAFQFSTALENIREILSHRAALAYTLAQGLVFGAFLGFLSSIQQILQELYKLGAQFPLYFAILAIGVGISNFLNTRLVHRFGMQKLVMTAQLVSVAVSVAALISCYWLGAVPPLMFVMLYLSVLMLGIGLLFGNLNTLSMEPFGHIAGMASSFIGVVSTLVAVVAGTWVGQSYNETMIPLILGFIILPGSSFMLTCWASGCRQDNKAREGQVLRRE